jgi:hypothetical protein
MRNDLLENVLKAHGGPDAWRSVDRIRAETRLDGPFWDWRRRPQIRRAQTITIDPRQVHITLSPFLGEGTTASYEAMPERVEILGPDGSVLRHRDDPRSSFPVYEDTIEWDDLQMAYFTGTANWNYLTEPFLFTYPGVEAHEIGEWKEGGETWRRLAVTFPPGLPNHNPDQTFYYDEDFLLRRMDYSPDVTGNSSIAHYTHEPRRFGGLLFYTWRTVHLRDADGIANQDFSAITVRTESVSVERG